jgi:hypothetical protein
MRKRIFYFICALLFVFGTAGVSWAIPLAMTEVSSDLTTNNSWGDGIVYSFLGGGIDLTAGHYDLTYSISGKVWAIQRGARGWETDDRIFITAALDDSLIGSTVLNGLSGQNRPFDFSLDLDFDLTTESSLEINVFSDVSHWSEVWVLETATLSGLISDEVYEENPVMPNPEPATMLLLGTGLAGLAAAGRRKLKKG